MDGRREVAGSGSATPGPPVVRDRRQLRTGHLPCSYSVRTMVTWLNGE